jgi:hypothetical protein
MEPVVYYYFQVSTDAQKGEGAPTDKTLPATQVCLSA